MRIWAVVAALALVGAGCGSSGAASTPKGPNLYTVCEDSIRGFYESVQDVTPDRTLDNRIVLYCNDAIRRQYDR